MTRISYGKVLKDMMVPTSEMLFGENGFNFLQDNAPSHTARNTCKWLEDHSINYMAWPANSSNLNPIENLWSIIKM